jgi:hypothetical protein
MNKGELFSILSLLWVVVAFLLIYELDNEE